MVRGFVIDLVGTIGQARAAYRTREMTRGTIAISYKGDGRRELG